MQMMLSSGLISTRMAIFSIPYYQYTFREKFQQKFMALFSTAKHEIWSISYDIYHMSQNFCLKFNMPFPFKDLDDTFAPLHVNILTKKNFPYLEAINHAIMKLWEGGFIIYSALIDDFEGWGENGFGLTMTTFHRFTTFNPKKESLKPNTFGMSHMSFIFIGLVSFLTFAIIAFACEFCK